MPEDWNTKSDAGNRTMPDTYVTAHHLRDLLNNASLEQLRAWSNKPGLLPRVPSGSDQAKGWDRLNLDTLHEFSRNRDVDIRFSAQTGLARRGEDQEPVSPEPAQRTLLKGVLRSIVSF